MFFTTYLQLIFGLDVPFLRSLFVHCSSFLYLPVRLAPSFVRLLFVFCSFFVRSLFVLCSSFLYLPVRLALSACAARTICPCGSHYLPVRLALSARAARTVLRLPVRLVPLTLHFSLNCFPILIKILHRDFFPVKANIFKLSCYLTAFAYNDDSEVF